MSLTKATYSMIYTAPVNALDYGADPTGNTDSTSSLQTAITEAWKTGKPLYVPSGTYLISSTLNIPPGGGYEYRADSFTIYGDGAENGFLGYNLGHGTTIITNTDTPILTYANLLANGNNLFIDRIRFQQLNSAATSAVLYFQIFMGWSVISNCQVLQAGTGDGIKMDYAYGGTIKNVVVMNRDNVSNPATRYGTGFNLSTSTSSGALLRLELCTARGFLNAFVLGNPALSAISTRFVQCQATTVTNGIVLDAGVRKAVIDNCYFEGISGTCVSDKGDSTTIANCFFFESYTVAIDSTYVGSRGSVYRDNEFQINTDSSTCIAIYSAADAPGYMKTIEGNYIYFIGSGGTKTNVVGVALTGANPCVNIINNNFRPRRAWVGGSGTIKILDSSTGYNTGTIPLTDSLTEVPFVSNVNIGYIPYSSDLTETSVSGGVLTLNPSAWNTLAFTTPTNVTQINDGAKNNRQVMLTNNNANATLVKGTYMILASNFTGSGTILLQLRVIAGNTYAYEISRTAY